MNDRATVAVFGHSKPDAEQYDLAKAIGLALGGNGYAVVNGGYGGVMEASARGAVEAGSVAIGVTCKAFSGRPNGYLSRCIETDNLQQRIGVLLELASAGCVILPGGTGTLVEFATAWELMNKRFMPPKPLVCVGRFWQSIFDVVCAGQKGAGDCVKFVDEVEELSVHFPRLQL